MLTTTSTPHPLITLHPRITLRKIFQPYVCVIDCCLYPFHESHHSLSYLENSHDMHLRLNMAPGSLQSPKHDSQTAPNPQDTFTCTSIAHDSFWGRRRFVVRNTTLRYQLDHLQKTGRFDQYKMKWHPSYDIDNGLPALFWDSDVGKWIEAACYFLMDGSGKDGKDDEMDEIESAVKEVVEDIRGAQEEDGYLNVHYQVGEF